MESARVLFSSIIDYAGLFPPSKLAMDETVANYAAYRRSGDAGMLGRLIVPFDRLAEFEHSTMGRLPTEHNAEPWTISVLVGRDLDREIDSIFAFNRTHAEEPSAGLAVIDTIELRADGPRSIDRALKLIPEQLTPFFEAPHDSDLRGLITALAGTGARAKIRCGGVTADKIPSVERLADFITTCAAADVAFKATAGLHHAIRAEQPLTYEAEPPRGVMHGFLNVFLAAAFVRRDRMEREEALELLKERDPSTFTFTDERVGWKDRSMESARLALVREAFAIGFGSCSFEEPVAELRALGALA